MFLSNALWSPPDSTASALTSLEPCTPALPTHPLAGTPDSPVPLGAWSCFRLGGYPWRAPRIFFFGCPSLA